MSFTEIGGLYGKNSVHQRKKGTQIWVAGDKTEPVNFETCETFKSTCQKCNEKYHFGTQTLKRLYKIWEWNSKGI